ncbi:MAG: hypothetical protein JW913_19440 [Chitinispirillaceae bacterium]|nr:hypothetical protein [Chitinispirillaceae bacterium]
MSNIDLKALYFGEIGEPNIKWFNGSEGLAFSPFHKDCNPSFSFNVDSGLSYDFSTGEGFDIYKFIMALHVLNRYDAAEYIRKRYIRDIKSFIRPVPEKTTRKIEPGKKWNYVEVVCGGLKRRKSGVVFRIDDFSEMDCFGIINDAEVHASVFNHSSALLKYKLKNRGSVARYKSEVKLLSLVFDFDHEEIEHARKDLLHLISKMKEVYQLKENEFVLFFSGNKGFHLYVAAPWIKEIKPSIDVPQRIKKVVMHWKNECPSIDENIYKVTSLIRVPNSLNTKSNLYKIPLSIQQVKNMTIEEIRNMAKKQRKIKW